MSDPTVNYPPVFIVGPVRSGSTFLRLMLDAHPQITNPGECDFLFDLVSEQGEPPDMRIYLEWLSSNRIFQAKGLSVDAALPYLGLMRSFLAQFQSGSARLTMNVHRHFHRIPWIFPDARYIRLLRDPRDVARSCIGMGWVGHVYFGADIWLDAERSWDKLREKLSSQQYIEIKYEELLDDVKGGLTRICRFLELEYSNQMLSYASNSTYSAPDKSLSFQWKSKYTTRELQLVEGKIGPILDRLGYERSGFVPARPGVLEKMSLYAQNKRYRIAHQVKRYGALLYLEGLLASRSGIVAWQHACQRRKNRIDVRHLK